MAGLALYLLQFQGITYYKEDNPASTAIVLVVVALFIIALAVINIKRLGIGNMGIRRGKSDSTNMPRKFSAFTLRRAAHSHGLNNEQTKLLESIFRAEAVTDPVQVMNNSAMLDKQFKRAYQRIERNSATDEEIQSHLFQLFSVRNTIDFFHNASSTPPNITENMAAVIAVNGESYPVRICGVEGAQILTECPHNALGSQIKIPKGSKVTLSFFTKSSQGFTINGQVTGIADTKRGPVLQIIRSGQVKSLTQRKFRRRQVGINCGYYLVSLEEQGGRKKEVKLVVNNRRVSGSILDISIGGCSIKTSGNTPAGTRLKIEFQYADGLNVAVLGQVLRLNRSGTINTIMHVKFLKVPRKAMNAINAMIFEYTN